MSERGSFITEYIYCLKCFEVAKKILIDQDKYLASICIPSWNQEDRRKEKTLPIIAGKIGGGGGGDELILMEHELIPKLEDVICCKMRIAVLAECGERIYTVIPIKDQE
ncbi:hypothetical protein LCGC14_2838260 [marine sediment metagenome]|uniref:Uncharacterized protein n=1 Tax=marine sediment metagenome TaxID=412755 RepID=A0A0F8YYN9_9ZZZZ